MVCQMRVGHRITEAGQLDRTGRYGTRRLLFPSLPVIAGDSGWPTALRLHSPEEACPLLSDTWPPPPGSTLPPSAPGAAEASQ